MKKIAGLILSAAMLAPAAAAAAGSGENLGTALWTEHEFAVMADLARAPGYADYRAANAGLPPAGGGIVFRKEALLSAGGDAEIVAPAEGIVAVPAGGTLELEAAVPESGRYRLTVEYLPAERRSAAVELSLRIDGEFPFKEAGNLPLHRKWKDDPNSRKTDGNGNDVRPPQMEVREWLRAALSSHAGETLEFALDKGVHTLSIGSAYQDIRIREISLSPIPDIPSYEDYLQRH